MYKLNNILIPLFIALQFLTRLPVSGLLNKLSLANVDIYNEANLSRTLKYYPAIGLLIGGCLVFLSYVLQLYAVEQPLYMAVIIIFVWLLFSGGLHLDGVADMADAWVGGLGDKNRTLEIMKDPTCGPFGVISIVLVLLLKLVFVYELIQINIYLLLFAPVIARAAVVLLLMSTPSARKGGMASQLYSVSEKFKNIFSVILFLLPLLYFIYTLANVEMVISVLISCSIFFIVFRINIINRVCGITGDLAGAFIEYTELLVMFTLITLLMLTTSS